MVQAVGAGKLFAPSRVGVVLVGTADPTDLGVRGFAVALRLFCNAQIAGVTDAGSQTRGPMPTTALALALLTTPLPEPVSCPVVPAVSSVAAGVFGRGLAPQMVGLKDPGGPLQQQRWDQSQRMSDRFGDALALEQVDRQLGRR